MYSKGWCLELALHKIFSNGGRYIGSIIVRSQFALMREMFVKRARTGADSVCEIATEQWRYIELDYMTKN